VGGFAKMETVNDHELREKDMVITLAYLIIEDWNSL
jgi:hypothetical protein